MVAIPQATVELVIATPDGTELGRSEPVMGGNLFSIHGMYDLAVVGDQIVPATLDRIDRGRHRSDGAADPRQHPGEGRRLPRRAGRERVDDGMAAAHRR